MKKTLFLIVLLTLCASRLFAQTEFGKPLFVGRPSIVNGECCVQKESKVNVEIRINEHGNVISAVALNGHPLLRPISAANSRYARFAPTKINGKAVPVKGFISYDYNIYNGTGARIVLCTNDRRCGVESTNGEETRRYFVVFKDVLNDRARFLAKPNFSQETKAVDSCESCYRSSLD